jgi:hypothetical protein
MSAGQLLKQSNQLKRAGRLDEAIALYYQAIDINPNFAWTYYELGDAFFKQGNSDEAIVKYHRAIEINPNAFLYYCLGNSLLKSNRLDEATPAYQRAIQLDPCFAECYNKLGEAQLKKGEHSQAVSSFREAVALNPNKAWYHLNLGEALANSGGWVATLNCYRSAVKLNPFQIIVHQSSMKIQPDELNMIQVEQPIFIVGSGHSGTSIMLAILGSHPNLYPITGESALFLKSESKVREIILSWDKECTEAGKKRWIEKTPPHIFIIKKLFSYRPNSKFIIMLRDGRDVVCSMKYRTDYEDFNARLDRWMYDNLAGLPYWQHPRVKVVKYENLVTDTELTLKDICNFLGEKYTDSLLEFHKTDRHWYSSEIVKPKEVDMKTHKQFRNWQINQPLFDGRGRWKQEMTEEEKVIFREKAQKYLLEFGYVQDDNWLTTGLRSKFEAIRLKPIVYQNQPGLSGEAGANINGPSLIRVPDWVAHSLGRYYLYFAHHNGQYIRLAYSNHLQGSWTVYHPGTLHIDQIDKAMCMNHIASPDVHVDHQNREIRMYFHGVHPKQGQVSFLATSKDGLHFTASYEVLGPFYMRAFQYGGWHYAIAKNENSGGVILRSKDGVTPFERGVDFIPNMRHAAVLLEKDTLIVFYSRIGDAPESILMSHVDLTQKWTSWIPSEPTLALEPEKDYEGVDLPIEPSQRGAAKGRVRQLRDPAVYQEDNKSWLLYSISGESGIAISELKLIIPTLN